MQFVDRCLGRRLGFIGDEAQPAELTVDRQCDDRGPTRNRIGRVVDRDSALAEQIRTTGENLGAVDRGPQSAAGDVLEIRDR